RFVRAGLGRSDPPEGRDWPTADEVLKEAEGDDTIEPGFAVRLVRLAVWRAEAETREGSWPRARVHFEQAVRFGERASLAPAPGLSEPAREREELLGALARARASLAAE